MRVLQLALVILAMAGGGAAWGEEADALYDGADLLGGPENARGVELLRGVIAEAAAAPQDAAKQQRAGRAHMFLDEDAAAAAAMERAVALDPKSARFAFWLGAARLATDPAKARVAFERSVELDPAGADGWFGLGRARRRTDDLAGAVTAFQKALELDPAYATAHEGLAQVLQDLERSDEAAAHYRKALLLEPDLVNAGYNLGLLEYLRGRFEAAREAWLSVEPHDPGDLRLKSKIVQAYFALGQYVEAEPWREKVRTLHAGSERESVRKLKEYCFDQFALDDLRVLAFEQFDRSPEALYRYVFRVSRAGKEIRRINLEPSPVAIELGLPGGKFLLGANDDEGHMTFDKRWDAEPPYPELKAAVIDAIQGKLEIVSRLRRSKDGGGTIEIR